jgi:GET complex subunit GET2
MSDSDDPALLQAQQEYIRSLLRAQEPQPEQEQQAEDPMMKMLNSLLGGTDASDPNNPGGLPFSPDDISKATGLPPFLTNMLMGQGKAPPTVAEEQIARIWTLIHVVFSLLAGIYVVYVLSSSTKLFGSSPPAPPTLKNPFLVFITGELLVHGTQMFLVDRAASKGMWAWWQILRDIARDGSIVVFMMGAASWMSIYQ